MKIIRQAVKYFLVPVLVLILFQSSAQCTLKGNKEVLKNWRSEYFNYFSLDSAATQLIKADSVLIFYFSNPENETNYAMPCCYYLAEAYAQSELKRDLKILYKKLEKEDSLNFSKAQKSWQFYYKTESAFIHSAFIGYSNVSKYGQGREIMIDDAARIYQMIKDRILTIRQYIEITTVE